VRKFARNLDFFWLTVVLLLLFVAWAVYLSGRGGNNCNGINLHGQCYKAEYATTAQTRMKGLSDRENLEAHKAMVFVFDSSERQCFWMKDMRFPIDIVWLDGSKKVIKIETNISPQTYPNSFCADNTKYVIELNADAASQTGLKIGDPIQF
jgi:uncharacterized membrane protein (UPF0127 family)